MNWIQVRGDPQASRYHTPDKESHAIVSWGRF